MRLGSEGEYDRARQNEYGEDDLAVEVPATYLSVLGLVVGACCFLAYLSIASVPPLMLGIPYNSFQKTAFIDSIYSPGRYFIGPWKKFLFFPSDILSIEFSNEPQLPSNGVRYPPLHTRTKEGLALHLQVSLQYRLIPDKVGQLYNEFNQNYDSVIVSTVRDTLIKAASDYEATQLWHDRAAFGDRMQKMVNKAISGQYATCWGLQLMRIDLPDAYEKSIVSTQVQGQQRRILEQEQVVMRIRAETGVIKADYDRQAKVILAQGRGNYTLTTQRAQAHAQQHTVDVQAEMITLIKGSLALDGSQLVMYTRYDAVDDLGDASIFFGFGGTPQVLVGSGSPV